MMMSGSLTYAEFKCTCNSNEIPQPSQKGVTTLSEEAKRALEFLRSQGGNYKKPVFLCLRPIHKPIMEVLNEAQYFVPDNFKWRSMVFEHAKEHIKRLN